MSETSASGAKESKTKDNTSFETTRDKSDKSIAKEATVLPPVVPKFAATQQQTTKFKRLTELRQQDRKKLITNQLKLKVESLDADEEQQLKSNLKTKVIAIAIAVGILPLLAVGTTWYLGNLSLDRATETREGEALKTVNIPRLQAEELIILIGTGAAAILAGALAAFWASRTIYSASLAAATATAEKYRQERGERTQLFTEAIYRIRASLNQEDILRATVEEARLAIGADRVLVYSLDEQSRGMMIAESVDPKFPRALGALIDDPCFSATYMEKYQNGRVQAVDNIDEANLTPCHLQQLEPFAVKANLVVPLMNEGKLIGLLIAHHCSGPHAWQQAEIDLFVQLATQAGFALDNAKLLAESANLQQRVEAEIKWKGYLKDATKHLYESLDEEEILKAGVEEARRVLECDRVVVYSVDRQSQGVIIAESVAAGWPRILGRKIEDPCFEAKYIQKYENGRVRAINNIYEAGMTQ
ncbi:MAG: GAF domain-containing protein [Prochloraceae cyanobacterium]